MKRFSVFLADVNYISPERRWSIIPVPLNIGFLAAFLRKRLGDSCQTRLFKHPLKLLDALAGERPDMAAFSNYIWNRNLSLAIARHVKALRPGCVTVMGGPNCNFAERNGLEAFVRKHPEIDFHIEGEGEVRLANLAACCAEHGFDLAAVKASRPAGTAYLDKGGLVVNPLVPPAPGSWSRLEGLDLDPRSGRLKSLDEVPSPYCSGVLDEFLADPDFCPIIETNRGCPFSCIYCNWGDMGKSKSAVFSVERVQAELDYIASKNVSRSPYLYVGDANFGLFPRDVEIAGMIRRMKDERGFPSKVYMYYAKNASERVVRIAEMLKDMTPISLSRQTQNEEVLRFIKRSNISSGTFSALAALARKLGVESKVELIYALPGESKESFYAGMRDIMGREHDGIHLFPAMLLDGSEMGRAATRERYGIKGEWRRIEGCIGRFGPVKAAEYEEIITRTAVLGREDYLEIRLFHLLQALFLDSRIYKDVETLLGEVPMFDFIQDVIANYPRAPAAFRSVIEAFIADSKAELRAEPPAEPTDSEVDAASDAPSKLNNYYLIRILHDPGARGAFHAFLKERVAAVGRAGEREIDAVLAYIEASVYPFDGSTSRRAELLLDAGRFAFREDRKAPATGFLLDLPGAPRRDGPCSTALTAGLPRFHPPFAREVPPDAALSLGRGGAAQRLLRNPRQSTAQSGSAQA
ncbi:MAG: radical SAM protein [Elusimicrobiota bacterium]|jgi:radical SAM superfamily enzyme YgiQ (UPF0313 family)